MMSAPSSTIERDLAHRLTLIGGVHLIGLAVAEFGSGIRRLAERAVKCRGILRGISQNRHLRMTVRIQFLANGAHAAIHHVGRRNDVRAGFHLGQCGLGQKRQGGIIVDFTILDQPAMAVAGVFVQADIADDHQVRQGLLHRAHGALHDAVRIVCARAHFILAFRNAKENHGGDAEVVGGCGTPPPASPLTTGSFPASI